MANPIWRLTKSATDAGATSVLAGLPAGRVIDIPAERVSVWWAASTVYGGSLNTGVNGVRLYIRNQTLNIKNAGSSANNDFTFLDSGSNAFSVASIELIDDYGFGNVLYSYSA